MNEELFSLFVSLSLSLCLSLSGLPLSLVSHSLWRPLVIMVCLLRYAQVIEHSHHCLLNTSALVSGCTNAVGLVMVGNFQVNPRGRGGEGSGAGHTSWPMG